MNLLVLDLNNTKFKFIQKGKHAFYWYYAFLKIADSDNDSHIFLQS